MKESKRNDEEKNEKAITKYNNPKRNKKNRSNFDRPLLPNFLKQSENLKKFLKTANFLQKAYKNRDKIKAMTKYSHLLPEDGLGYKIDQLNNYNKLTSLVVKNQDLILSANIPKITQTIKECTPYFQNIDIKEEDVCWALGGLAGLIGSIFLGEAGAIVGLVSIGILIAKGESLNSIFQSSYKILENEDMRKIILDPNKLGATLEVFETMSEIKKREEKEEERKKEEAKKNNTHKKIQYDDGTYYEGNVNDNGLPNGKGIIYNKNNNISYEGDFVNGKKEGKGKLYSKSEKFYYIGEFKNDKRHGKGTEYYKNNNIRYVGDYINGKREGNGKSFSEDEKCIYSGEYKNGKKHGKGVQYYKNGNIFYKGDFIEGEWEGNGELFSEDKKCVYTGEFKKSNYHGKGIIYDKDNNISYEGDFVKGKKEGKGKLFYESKNLYYIGEFKNDKKHGKGTEYYFKNNNIHYEGDFVDGKKHGKGIEYYENGFIEYKGDFIEGDREGNGELYDYDFNGHLLFSGQFENGFANISNLY